MELFLFLIFLWTLCDTSSSSNCRRELSYHDSYGYGYDIHCENLTTKNMNELSSMEVYNEVLLTISHSNISSLDNHLFKELRKLRQIVISDTDFKFSEKDQIFKELPQLEKITFISNNISIIKEHYFEGATSLRSLILSNDMVSKIEKSSLKSLDISLLDLSNNKLDDLDDACYCEPGKLRIFILKNNSIDLVPGQNFQCLQKLEKLDLAFNKISNLYNCFNASTNLVHLNLSYNYIKTFSQSFQGDIMLEDLDLSHNRIESIVSSTFKQMPKLKILNLAHNFIASIEDGSFKSTDEIENLNLENNKLQNIKLDHLISLKILNLAGNLFSISNLINFKDMFRLRTLILSRNNIEEVPDKIFTNLKTLEVLDLSSNRVKIGGKSFLRLNRLTALNLKNNSITTIDKDTFRHLLNLRALDISENDINTLESTTFSELVKLETLNLSYNNLLSLDHRLVTPMYSLKVLDLENNKLESIDYKSMINEIRNLQVFNVKENLLSCKFLAEMISFLKLKNIRYKINENFKYDKENVEGIYCKETEEKLNETLEATRLQVENNNRLLNELYNITLDSDQHYSTKISETILVCIVVFSVAIMVLSLISYRAFVYLKKRRLFNDELELICREKM